MKNYSYKKFIVFTNFCRIMRRIWFFLATKKRSLTTTFFNIIRLHNFQQRSSNSSYFLSLCLGIKDMALLIHFIFKWGCSLKFLFMFMTKIYHGSQNLSKNIKNVKWLREYRHHKSGASFYREIVLLIFVWQIWWYLQYGLPISNNILQIFIYLSFLQGQLQDTICLLTFLLFYLSLELNGDAFLTSVFLPMKSFKVFTRRNKSCWKFISKLF